MGQLIMEWASTHPYLTFVLVMSMMVTFIDTVHALCNSRKKRVAAFIKDGVLKAQERVKDHRTQGEDGETGEDGWM